MTHISLKEMAQNAVHFGHPTARWNPKMKPYIYGSRHGIHIFDLNKSEQCRKLLQEIKEETGMPIVTDKWIPGLLTNFKTIKQRIDHFKQLKEDDASGALSKYTKKEHTKLRKEIQKLSMSLSGVENMKGKPDVLFVSDIVRDNIAVTEARKLKIPVIGIVDSNADHDKVDFVIPANDDAIKSLEFILGLAKEAVKSK